MQTNIKHKATILGISLSIIPLVVFGDTTVRVAPQIPTYTLDQAVSLGLKSSTDLEIANRNIGRDEARVDESEAAGRPRLTSSGQYTHLDSPVRVKIGNAAPLEVEPEDTETLTAGASLPLDISGQIKAASDAQRLQTLADRFQRDTVYNSRVLYATSTYYNFLRAEHQVQVAESSLANAKAQQDIAQKQFQGGVGQRIDFLRAQTQVAQAQKDLLSAQNSLVVARNNFNDLIGDPIGTNVQAVDTAGVATGLAIQVGANDVSRVDVPDNTFYSPPIDNIDLDQGLEYAAKNRPELHSDEVSVQAASKQIFIARQGLAPALSVSATGNYYPVTDFQNPRHSIGVFGATLSIPLYDGGATRDRIKEANYTKQNAESQLSSDKTTVELEVRQAYSQLMTAAEQITAANSALQEAIAARRLAQIRYSNGVGLYLEVTDAEQALTQSETQQVNAVYDYLTAKAQYQNAIGSPQVAR